MATQYLSKGNGRTVLPAFIWNNIYVYQLKWCCFLIRQWACNERILPSSYYSSFAFFDHCSTAKTARTFPSCWSGPRTTCGGTGRSSTSAAWRWLRHSDAQSSRKFPPKRTLMRWLGQAVLTEGIFYRDHFRKSTMILGSMLVNADGLVMYWLRTDKLFFSYARGLVCTGTWSKHVLLHGLSMFCCMG